MNSKRGFAISIETILVLAVVAVVGYILFAQTEAGAKDFGAFWTPQKLGLAEDTCRYNAERDGIILTNANDVDGDGLYDACDTCVCPRECCKNTREYDLDYDRMPRCCDKDDNTKEVIGCVFTAIDGRCVEGAPPPNRKV